MNVYQTNCLRFYFVNIFLTEFNEGRFITHKSIDLLFSDNFPLVFFYQSDAYLFSIYVLLLSRSKNTWTSGNISTMICEIVLMKKECVWKNKIYFWTCWNNKHVETSRNRWGWGHDNLFFHKKCKLKRQSTASEWWKIKFFLQFSCNQVICPPFHQPIPIFWKTRKNDTFS